MGRNLRHRSRLAISVAAAATGLMVRNLQPAAAGLVVKVVAAQVVVREMTRCLPLVKRLVSQVRQTLVAVAAAAAVVMTITLPGPVALAAAVWLC